MNQSSLQIPVPPRESQRQFGERARSIEMLIRQVGSASDRLEDLFSTLIQRTFSGQLTAKWREAHLKELLAEMEVQARLLKLPMLSSLEVTQ